MSKCFTLVWVQSEMQPPEVFLNRKFHRKTLALESTCNFIKKDSNTGVFQ